MPTEVVVFDLGGVLNEFTGISALHAMGLGSPGEIAQRWLNSESVTAFERGRCTPEAFATAFLKEWGIRLEPKDFLAQFLGWVRSPYPGAIDLVTAVGSKVTVACLSNTNELHWNGAGSRWPLTRLFDDVFLSFQLGVAKPDPVIFVQMVDRLGVPPSNVLFVDDNQTNVDSARTVGLTAALARGVEQARAAVEAAGVL